LDEKGYEFYDLIKATTETLGTVFDPQPSMIKGNIKCVNDPTELVIGYVSASTIAEKRIFIAHSELPYNWFYDQDCPSIYVKNLPDSLKYFFSGGAIIPASADLSNTGAINGYFSAYARCADVTQRGASVTMPPYW
jgi:hypothetical protein